MRRKITLFWISLLIFGMREIVISQTPCGPTTPTYTVDLTGNPNGTWISPVIVRNDTCCGAQAPDACVQFIITLDPTAQGIAFNIYSGSVPPGAMYYQINCGPNVAVGSPICLQGPGPHYLTFCKPGNNSNEYSITSLSQPIAHGDTMAMGCIGGMVSATGYYEPSITWTSIFPGPQGAYNSYLSCASGCDTAFINPSPGSPAYIDYVICGLNATLCDTIPTCDTIRVHIFSTLQVTVSGTPVLCSSTATGSFSANASGGAAPYTYTWSNGGNGQTITGLSAGTYSVLITDANGCTISGVGTIIQPLALTASISQTDVSCFGGQNGTGSVLALGGTSPYTYFWPSCGCTTSAVNNLAAGSYFATITDANGCSISQNISIGQPPLLTLNIISTTNVTCFGGNNGSASVVATGGALPYTFVWSTTPVQNGPNATNLVAGNYNITVVDMNGCSQALGFAITEPPALLSVVNPNAVTCYNGSNGSATVVPSGGTPSYTYAWSPGGGTGSTAIGLAAGTYSVTVTDTYGCSYVNTVSVSQPPFLAAAVTNIQHVTCFNLANGSGNVSVTGGVPPYQYAWSNGQTNASIGSVPSGIYQVAVTDQNGCHAVASVTITQPAALTVSAGSGSTICPGQSANVTANATGGTTPHTYFWQPNIGFGNTQIVSPNTTTTYTAIVTDANGCTTTNTTTVTVHNNNFAVAVNSTPGICFGQSATVSATISGSGIFTYTWSNNLGNTPGPHVVVPLTSTTYSVNVTNACGMVATAAATIDVHPLPVVNLTPQTVEDCEQAGIQFEDTSLANVGSSYVWTFGDGASSTLPNPVHTYYQSGTYNVGVTVISPFGCVGSALELCTVTIYPNPLANFSTDPHLKTSIINPSFNFYDLSTNAISWSWDFGDGQTSNLQNPSHTYAQVGIYTVKLVTQNYGGCIDSIMQEVEVKPEFTFYIPNSFTPNGDHINDVFTGKGLEIVEYEMTIYDRWGNKIFETNDLNNGWDGRANGGSYIAQQDVYVYEVKLRDFERTQHVYYGHVNLLR